MDSLQRHAEFSRSAAPLAFELTLERAGTMAPQRLLDSHSRRKELARAEKDGVTPFTDGEAGGRCRQDPLFAYRMKVRMPGTVATAKRRGHCKKIPWARVGAD
jgi:hypothetical protein